MNEEKISGIMIYYYHVCKRKLWYYRQGIGMESENSDVIIGKILDENTYEKKRKHILINGEINIDFVEKNGIIHEIKKSKSIEEASVWQVKYYLYYLKKQGVENVTAKIDYPLLKKILDIELSDYDEKTLDKIIEEVKDIVENKKVPDYEKKNFCKKCAFFDLCAI